MDSIKTEELHMHVEPGMWTRWHGTEEQLRDSGLLPVDVPLPAGMAVAEWTADGSDFALWRYRRRAAVMPTGAKKRDQWLLQASPTATRGIGSDGGAALAAIVGAATEASAAIATAAASDGSLAASAADAGFQRMMAGIVTSKS